MTIKKLTKKQKLEIKNLKQKAKDKFNKQKQKQKQNQTQNVYITNQTTTTRKTKPRKQKPIVNYGTTLQVMKADGQSQYNMGSILQLYDDKFNNMEDAIRELNYNQIQLVSNNQNTNSIMDRIKKQEPAEIVEQEEPDTEPEQPESEPDPEQPEEELDPEELEETDIIVGDEQQTYQEDSDEDITEDIIPDANEGKYTFEEITEFEETISKYRQKNKEFPSSKKKNLIQKYYNLKSGKWKMKLKAKPQEQYFIKVSDYYGN